MGYIGAVLAMILLRMTNRIDSWTVATVLVWFPIGVIVIGWMCLLIYQKLHR